MRVCMHTARWVGRAYRTSAIRERRKSSSRFPTLRSTAFLDLFSLYLCFITSLACVSGSSLRLGIHFVCFVQHVDERASCAVRRSFVSGVALVKIVVQYEGAKHQSPHRTTSSPSQAVRSLVTGTPVYSDYTLIESHHHVVPLARSKLDQHQRTSGQLTPPTDSNPYPYLCRQERDRGLLTTILLPHLRIRQPSPPFNFHVASLDPLQVYT